MIKIFIILLTFINFNVYAFNLSEQTNYKIGSQTGYKLPRFATLKSDKINLRVGSSKNYPIVLQYNVKNLPIEILDEYDNWREIIDIDGNHGWILGSLLTGKKYAIIKESKKKYSKLYSKPNGLEIGKIGNLNIVKVNTCLKKWCFIGHNKDKGWIKKKNIWGVYENELINVPVYQPLKNLLWKIN